MNTEHHHIELFDCYLKNQLNELDKKQFEEKLISNKDFKAQFDNYLLIVESIKQQKRDELKQYFKKNVKMEYWGQNFWGKKWTIAASIAFLIFGSLYFVTSQLSKNISNKELVINNEQNQEPKTEDSDDKNLFTENKEPEKNKKTEFIIPNVIENDEKLSEEVTQKNEAYDFDESPASIPESEDFKDELVAKETLVKTLKLNVIQKSSSLVKEKASASKPSTNLSTESKKGVSLNKNENVSQATENEAKDEQVKKDLTILNYTVEIWKHPLNFVGYTFENSVLKLYGYTSENISIFKLNDNNFIKIDNIIYSFTNCKNCKLTIETNQEIINSLNQ